LIRTLLFNLTYFLIGFISSYAQEINLTVSSSFSLEKPVNFFEVDQIGNIYCVTNNEIIKLTQKGLLQYRYSNMTYGNITKLDVQNSLRPLVFYRQQSKIVVLDNTLSEQSNYCLNLDQLGLYNTLTIANSNLDNGVWIYELDFKQLIKVNTKLGIVQQSGNLAVLLGKDSLMPIKILEKNGRLYMSTKNDGVLIFDVYCSYIHSLNITNTEDIQVNEEHIFINSKNAFVSYNSINHEITNYIAPKNYIKISPFKSFFIGLNLDGKTFDLLSSE
tara:strand:- start:1126 stop:1947 length:822 start_codon:yes stop_codon:yes gene_type:complete